MAARPRLEARAERVSTQDQNPEHQRAEMARWCAARGWEPRWYVEKMKGTRNDSPVFARLIGDALAGGLRVVVVWALDRMGRDQDFMLAELLRALGLCPPVGNVAGKVSSSSGPLSGSPADIEPTCSFGSTAMPLRGAYSAAVTGMPSARATPPPGACMNLSDRSGSSGRGEGTSPVRMRAPGVEVSLNFLCFLPRKPSLLALAMMLGVLAGCRSWHVLVAPRLELRAGTSGDPISGSGWEEELTHGFSVSLVERFAAEHGFKSAWVRFRWPKLVKDLEAGKFDLASSGIIVRPERSVAGYFTVPVLRNSAVLLLRRPGWAPAPATSLRPTQESSLAEVRALDRPELRVAVKLGGHLEHVAQSLFRHAQVQVFPYNATLREALVTGQADAVLSNTFEAPRLAKGLTGIDLLGPLTRDVVAIYVHPDWPELAGHLDAWLLKNEANGTLGAVRARYWGVGAKEPTALPVQALLAATAERLALMPLVAAAKQREGKPLEDTTQETLVLASFRTNVRNVSARLRVAPPSDEALSAFLKAQTDAAKSVQQRAPADAAAPTFSLETELLPALNRIGVKMAALVAHLPDSLDEAAVLEQARDWLGDSGVETSDVEQIARTLAALGVRPPVRPRPPRPR